MMRLEENVLWKLNPLSSGSPEGDPAPSRTFRVTTCVLETGKGTVGLIKHEVKE